MPGQLAPEGACVAHRAPPDTPPVVVTTPPPSGDIPMSGVPPSFGVTVSVVLSLAVLPGTSVASAVMVC